MTAKNLAGRLTALERSTAGAEPIVLLPHPHELRGADLDAWEAEQIARYPEHQRRYTLFVFVRSFMADWEQPEGSA